MNRSPVIEIPGIIYGSEHWLGVVAEHERLGKSREEAERWVNAFLVDQDTLPMDMPRPIIGYSVVPINENGITPEMARIGGDILAAKAEGARDWDALAIEVYTAMAAWRFQSPQLSQEDPEGLAS